MFIVSKNDGLILFRLWFMYNKKYITFNNNGFTLKYQSTIARNPAYVNWIAVLDDNSKSDSGE